MTVLARLMDRLFGPPPKIRRAIEANSEAVRRLQAALEQDCALPSAVDDLSQAYQEKKEKENGRNRLR